MPAVTVTRRLKFNAAHRVHNPAFSDEENSRVFGKCNNPHGHGHNYTVQVTLSGQVDPATGMVCNLADLDAFAQRNLIDRFDHQNLNTLDCFQHSVSSTENLTMEIYRIFQAFRAAHLEHISIEETSNNSFEYSGSGATRTQA
jgi:6-pyruvoyltetrahydropterin/6-carboxytetrahydropterin synthase